MKKIAFGLLFFNLFSFVCFSQEQHVRLVDSLLRALTTTNSDTGKINIINQVCTQYLNVSDYENALKYAYQAREYGDKILSSHKGAADEPVLKKALALAYNSVGRVFMSRGNYSEAMEYFTIALKLREEIADKKGIGNSYNNIGIIYSNQGNYEKALENHKKALEIRKGMNDKAGIAMSYNNIGIIHYQQGNYEEALKNHLSSLKLKEEMGDKGGVALSYNNIGIIYEKRGDTVKALDNYMKYLKTSQETGDKQAMSYAFNNIGNMYMYKKDFKNALQNQLNSLKIKEELGDKAGMSMSYNNIGAIYEIKNDYKRGFENHLKSFEISKSIGDTLMMSIACNNVGNMNFKMGNIQEALRNNNQALEWAQKIGYKAGIRESYLALAGIYENKKDYKKAYEYHELYSETKGTLLNEESSKQLAEMNIKYDSEKKDKELIKKDSEIAIKQAEAKRKQLQRNGFILAFVLILFLAFYIYRGYRQKQTSNKQLEEKNVLIESQKKLVEEKNLKITDSINYAKRIQQAILPSNALIKSAFSDAFVLFNPKDIVSGDFYWYSELVDKNCKIIIVADCTGHGVPGAFMSMIGNTLLNEIVNIKGICSPAEILDKLNKGVVHALNQDNNMEITQDDGMDVTVVAVNTLTNIVEYAAANHFSYFYHEGKFNLLKGDIYSIGGMFGKVGVTFTNQKLRLESDSALYLFTDGFLDQYGGAHNKKFSSLRFEQLLESMKQLPMEEQKNTIMAAFNEWKGNNKQLDDILILGLRI